MRRPGSNWAWSARLALLLSCAALVACQGAAQTSGQSSGQSDQVPGQLVFPQAERPVSSIVSTQWSTENERDLHKEAASVMDLAGVVPGMSVADIGAGEGYYTVRLAGRVGAKGRVLAQDIDARALSRLGARAERERLAAISIVQGTPDDPRLPENSFDRIFMIHMYHEVAQPYAFLWRIWPALKDGGHIVVVDLDRPSDHHGITPALLTCEFAAAGFRLSAFRPILGNPGYYAQFTKTTQRRPEPGEMKPCRAGDGAAAKG
ncbi:class I SAM-dependent methyltransferase [Novosphingobium sp. Chol11]|uniref:class I SAM-dependent methyltransferase n=1 Tax=Novosphingobium sp. Chol11 TaxID=1385763 RepID=UPI0025E09515|nr:class I SAM-dependent methyltransferase [Novosphingobium sp. Chol11]